MSEEMNGGGKFLQTLIKVGFPGAKDLDGCSFDWMFETKPLVPFLDWFCDSVDRANVLTEEELHQYEELKCRGSVLKEEVLEKALHCLTFESQSVPLDVLREKVSLIRAELSSVEARVNELTHQRDVLSIQLSQNNHYGLLMEDLLRDLQHDLCKQQEQFVSVSKQVSSSIHSTVEPIEGLISFYTQEMKKWKEPDSCNHFSVPGSFFTSLDVNSYYETEERFLDQLRAYIKKQFCQPMADLVAGEQSLSECELLDLDSSELQYVFGPDNTTCENYQQELDRLRHVLQVTEEARVKEHAQERSLDVKVTVLQDKLKKLDIEDFTSDAVLIRKHQEQMENSQHSVQHQVLELLKSAVPNAVQQYVQMNSAVVITGDYQLKLARQEYFLDKQNIVIEHLLKQRARQEFLQMVMEVEAQTHRDLYSLLQKLQNTLQEEWKEFEERMCEMTTVQQQIQERSASTIDSADITGKALLNILEGSDTAYGTLFPTYAGLAEAAEKLEKQNRALQENILTNRMEQVQCLDSLEGELKKWLNLTYGNTTVESSQPITGPRELAEGLTKLASKVQTLEKRVLDGMRDFDRRKKQLQTNPLQIKERELFVSFFLSPKHLKTEVETLLAQAEGEMLLKQK